MWVTVAVWQVRLRTAVSVYFTFFMYLPRRSVSMIMVVVAGFHGDVINCEAEMESGVRGRGNLVCLKTTNNPTLSRNCIITSHRGNRRRPWLAYLRNKLYDKTLKSQNYYSNILWFPVPWRSALWLGPPIQYLLVRPELIWTVLKTVNSISRNYIDQNKHMCQEVTGIAELFEA